MTLSYTRRANAQPDSILSHVASHSRDGAANLLARVEEVENMLRQFPRSGRMTTIPGGRRVAIVPYPYVLDYRCVGGDVIVQRIRHPSRLPRDR